ncbi:hypothetical protein A6A04_00790 [Paramagnetospirillum marisnigri]|uniref:PABS domain-containing protein n=1 Tax=Paramagnetospirillum marisnigri TaxID=1285242 RepID=A0A178MSM9_9PROT|nr:fused MFS/spermidine synthase [Paramagnetospirillum marisnigri]OAN52262.1 hypothetical protein A6A04_00790 [Paramagnetospirillum marisnigri]
MTTERVFIFLTGAAVLALELISSRALNPFFGVALYIWTGVLSTTLVFLSVGYYLGGRLARDLDSKTLTASFHALIAASGLALAVSVHIYPVVLGPLARFSLVLGSFAACAVILCVPLIALSALNPLLVALERRNGPGSGESDDAGAGIIFFISTLGSVAGVSLAAFVLIAHWSNRESIALIALSLAVMAVAGALARRKHLARGPFTAVLVLALLGGMAAAAVLVEASRASVEVTDGQRRRWSILAERPTPFGTLKVARVTAPDGTTMTRLLNVGESMNGFLPGGESSYLFTYMIGAGTRPLVDSPRRALVLGFGAGVVPSYFASQGAQVDAVEINPEMERLARDHFGFRPRPDIRVVTADARTFVQGCRGEYDVVSIDLFFGDGIPEHLTTREFFADVRNCLAPQGVIAMNSLFVFENTTYYRHLVATMVSVFGAVALLEEPQGPGAAGTNYFIYARKDGGGFDAFAAPLARPSGTPAPIFESMVKTMKTARVIQPGSPFIAGIPVVRDETNPMAMVGIPLQTIYRVSIVTYTPDAILVD